MLNTFIRFRPFNKRESEREINHVNGTDEIIDIEWKIEDGKKLLTTYHLQSLLGKRISKSFVFDGIIDEDVKDEEFFKVVGRNPVLNFMNGHDSALIIYGQTGSGKNKSADALLEYSSRMIFEKFSSLKGKFKVSISVIEIYMERAYDLLAEERKSLRFIFDKRINSPNTLRKYYLEGLIERETKTREELMECFNEARTRYLTRNTSMGKHSSRDHVLRVIHLEHRGNKSKLVICRIGGSEKVRKTAPMGMRIESKRIGWALRALDNVINSLVKKKHIPYRDSKITRYLERFLPRRDDHYMFSTTFIICGSKSEFNFGETLSSIRFAHRAMKLGDFYQKKKDLMTSQKDRDERLLFFQLQENDIIEKIQLKIHGKDIINICSLFLFIN